MSVCVCVCALCVQLKEIRGVVAVDKVDRHQLLSHLKGMQDAFLTSVSILLIFFPCTLLHACACIHTMYMYLRIYSINQKNVNTSTLPYPTFTLAYIY